MKTHLTDPLADKPLWSNDQRFLDQPAKFEFTHDQTSLDGLAQTNFIRQQIAHAVVCNGAGQGTKLVRKRNDRRFDGREQDILGQCICYASGGSDVGDFVW